MLTDKGSTLASKLLTALKGKSGMKTAHAIMKQAQTNGVIEWSHQKLKQILIISVADDAPQWD